jgi:hypothetical protein
MSLMKIKMKSKDVFAFEAIGEICKDDYVDILFPILEEARANEVKVRLLLHFGERFKGFTKKSIWEDLKFGKNFTKVIDRCAIVSDMGWIIHLSSIFGSLIPCSIEVFDNIHLSSAISWIDSGDLALDFSFDQEKGLLEVEIEAPLNSLNFEVMSSTVDSYILNNKNLNGLLIHAKRFPGWKNLGSFISYIKFMKSHRKKIKKVALVTNSKLANIVPRFSDYFMNADIKNFAFKDLKKARKWIVLR